MSKKFVKSEDQREEVEEAHQKENEVEHLWQIYHRLIEEG